MSPDSYSYVASQHTSLSAARKAVARYRAEMRQACGPTAWNDHFAIFALKGLRLKTIDYCQHCGREMVEYADWGADCIEPRLQLSEYCSAACVELAALAAGSEYEDYDPHDAKSEQDIAEWEAGE